MAEALQTNTATAAAHDALSSSKSPRRLHKALLPRSIWAAVVVLGLAGLPSIDGQEAQYLKPDGHNPLAPHQLVVVPRGGNALVTLQGYDLDGDKLRASVTKLPASGATLYQLSRVFSDYGYEPIHGKAMASAGETVTGSQNRVYYKRPTADVEPIGAWDVVEFTVSDLTLFGVDKSTSLPGKITFVPPSGIIVGSHFGRDTEGWEIVGNKAASHAVTYEASSRGQLNQYVYGSDDTINTDVTGGSDRSIWFFVAPAKFHGHHGIAYGGALEFLLSSFHGDFRTEKLNRGLDRSGLHLVEIHCAECNTNRGVTIAFPLSAATPFTGSTTHYSIPLIESAGWIKDPKNTLLDWTAPTQCEFIEVLSSISSLRILGDFTSWYESVALDQVHLKNTEGQIPVCAQQRPDASECTCASVNWKNTHTSY